MIEAIIGGVLIAALVLGVVILVFNAACWTMDNNQGEGDE